MCVNRRTRAFRERYVAHKWTLSHWNRCGHENIVHTTREDEKSHSNNVYTSSWSTADKRMGQSVLNPQTRMSGGEGGRTWCLAWPVPLQSNNNGGLF